MIAEYLNLTDVVLDIKALFPRGKACHIPHGSVFKITANANGETF